MSVLVIMPKSGLVTLAPGAANCGVFRKFTDSARNCSAFYPDKGKRLAIAAFTL